MWQLIFKHTREVVVHKAKALVLGEKQSLQGTFCKYLEFIVWGDNLLCHVYKVWERLVEAPIVTQSIAGVVAEGSQVLRDSLFYIFNKTVIVLLAWSVEFGLLE